MRLVEEQRAWMEGWKAETFEPFASLRAGCWHVGRLEGWKGGRMEDWAMVNGDGPGRGVGRPWRMAVDAGHKNAIRLWVMRGLLWGADQRSWLTTLPSLA
jgi:hypothetical protein